MSEPADPKKTTGEELAAVREELHEVSGIMGEIRAGAQAKAAKARERESEGRYTPIPIAESTDRMVREIAGQVFDDRIKGHSFDCMLPGGPLGIMAGKVDGMSRKIVLATGALLLVGGMLPFFWNRLAARLDVLDGMKQQITRLEERIGHSQNESAEPPTFQFATRAP